jgi:hypothetical protein
MLGTNATQIHNIVLSSCNAEGAFSTSEIRKHFPNATNIMHSAAGELGYQSMFRQVLTSPSWTIEPTYETCIKGRSGKLEYLVGNNPSPKAIRFAPYIAELFVGEALTPFKVQIAGRELLAPSEPVLTFDP